MLAKLFLLLPVASLLTASTFIPGPSPCTTSSLNVYQSLGPTGCTQGGFIFKNFSFQTLSALNGAVPVESAAITVTPSVNQANLAVKFTSTRFSISGSQFVQYLIGYTVDPVPPVIIRFDEDLLAESPVAPGTADINTALCIGGLFSTGGICSEPGIPASLHVFHHGTPTDTKLFDEATFPGTNLVDVRNTITLAANGATSQITGFDNVIGIPEPAAWLMGGSGLLLLLFRRSRAKAL